LNFIRSTKFREQEPEGTILVHLLEFRNEYCECIFLLTHFKLELYIIFHEGNNKKRLKVGLNCRLNAIQHTVELSYSKYRV
jgi:hypothetical protein